MSSRRTSLFAAVFASFAAVHCGARSALTAGDDSSGGSGAATGGSGGTSGGAGGTSGGSAGMGGTVGSAGAGSGGCPSDLDSDPKHCGRCNRDCEGGKCSFGICQPVLVAQLGDEAATALALDETNVFWARPITRMPKAPGTPVQLSRDTPDAVWGIAAFDTHVYWGSPTYGPVRRIPKIGAATAQALTSDDLGANRIAVDASGVYFTSKGVWHMAHDGSGLRQLTPEGDTGIALDADFVYFTSRIAGRVYRIGKNGQELVILASTPFANEVAVYGTLVAFTAQGDGLVRLVPYSGGEAIPIASGADGVAIDSEVVYFTDATSERVGYFRNDGHPSGESIVLALGLGRPRAIAVDQTRVFWTTDAPLSAVYKVVKSGPGF